MDELRVVCARIQGNELVAAECAALTGGTPDAEGVALCQRLDLIPRAAFITLGVCCLAQARTLDDLCAQIATLPLAADRFRLEYLSLWPQNPLPKPQVVLAVANALPAYPDLDHPQHRFLVAAQAERLWFGEILAEPSRDYRLHDTKPYRTSSSLSSRLARALVNLVAPPAGSILDPFCGTGSLLLEAAALGLQPFGLDHNIKMVGMSRCNLTHFGYAAQVELGDAQECIQTADAIVTDLPYGRLLEQDQAALRQVLHHTAQLAPQAVYLAEEDITPWLQDAGYTRVACYRVRKHHTMSRFVHHAWRE
jgi:tRNA (guanine10-N2)-dimethyltransferase